MPTPENSAALQAEYRDAARLDARITLHANYGTHPVAFYRWVFDHLSRELDGRAPMRILDIGCGSGRLWSENQDRIPARWRLVLADLSAPLIAATARRLTAGPAQVRFAAAAVQQLPFAAGSFDAVVATHMLYHVPDRARAYVEVQRVLRPGGSLYASTNSRYTMQRYDALLAEARGMPWRAGAGINDSTTARGFTLEHGQEELAAAFPHVVLQRYDDELCIPDPAPLVAYAAASGHLAEAELDRLHNIVAARILAEGPLHIPKAAGLFVARVA